MNNIIEKIAKNHNCTPEEVEKEITFAISKARSCDSPKAKEFWGNVKNNVSIETIIFLLSKEILQ